MANFKFDFGNFQLSYTDIVSVLQRNRIVVGSSIVIGLGLFGVRLYANGGVCRSTVRLDGKTVIITGCNTGIGRETALDIAKRGARVIMACRDITKAERAAEFIIKESGNKNVHVRVLDLASLESVRKFSKEIKATEKKIHVLINNAGVMMCPKWTTADGFEMQIGTNHLGHFLLTSQLLPILKSSVPSRIVNVSSSAHQRGEISFDDINLDKENAYGPQKAYCQSKLANVLFTKELNRQLNGSGVTTYALHPGVIHTELGRYLPSWASALIFFGRIFLMKSERQGAQTTIYCAVAEGIEADSGKYFSDCAVKKPAPQAEDDECARKLWTVSKTLVGS